MKFVIQRVTHASVTVEEKIIGNIDKGFLVLIGICNDDTEDTADKMIKKTAGLRIFDDENDRINLSVKDVGGRLLVISQFTLYANCTHGNRPDFLDAMPPREAEALYEYFISECEKYVPGVEKGVFGAEMKVSLLNDGPFTVILE